MLQYGAGMQVKGRFPLQVTMVTILKSPPWLPKTTILTKPNAFGGSSGSPLYTPAGKLYGLHFAGNPESDSGCHLAHQTVKPYVDDARLLIINVSKLERAHLAQSSPPSNDPDLAAGPRCTTSSYDIFAACCCRQLGCCGARSPSASGYAS